MKGYKNDGFTLVEMLIALAVTVILLAIGIVGVVQYQSHMKITELDNMAREIYMAAQNRAVLLQNSGRLESRFEGVGTLASASSGGGTHYISHISSSSDAAVMKELLPVGSIDLALWDGKFYIVYEPDGGFVTDVFFVEEGDLPEIGEAFQKAGEGRNARMKNKPMLGYYGSETADGIVNQPPLSAPGVEVLIENGEELTVTVRYSLPESLPDAAVRTIDDVKLKYGDEEIVLPFEGSRFSSSGDRAADRSFSCTWVLDSLKSGSGMQFKDLFGGSIVPGDDFTVTAGLTLSADGYISSTYKATGTDNSLFAKGSIYDITGGTAKIANLRHLQNLHPGYSDVGGGITAAEQVANIDCTASRKNDGTVLNASYRFIPIVNGSLNIYDGRKKNISNLSVRTTGSDSAGLFGEITGTDAGSAVIQGVRLVNATVIGGADSNAGGLAGAAVQCDFSDCRVYWEPANGKETAELLTTDSGINYRVSGKNAGGLAGVLSGGSIMDSFAATTVNGSAAAGGLAGFVTGGGPAIGSSYADCYLYSGNSAGGLVGSGTIASVENCYAAGFSLAAAGKTAGLAGGSVAVVSNTYSVVRVIRTDATLEDPGTLLCAGNDGDEVKKVYYLRKAEDVAADTFGAAFEYEDDINSPETHVYGLRSKLYSGVVDLVPPYPFPGLKNLPHYGDWKAQLMKVSLVYYEDYGSSGYGFYGGGVDCLKDIKPVKDGYAVAVQEDIIGSTAVNLKVKIDDVESLYVGVWYNVVIDGDPYKYYIAPLDGQTNIVTADDKFYQKLTFTIGDGADEYSYYYCPHFAKTAVKTTVRPQDPKVAYVRTPRHLYMLSEYKKYYCHNSYGYTFRQELDLDYSVYTGYGLFDEGFMQDPIGSNARQFNGTYDGGCHIIKNVAFRSDGDYAGLFGYSAGTLKNIVYYMNGETLERTVSVSLGNHGNRYIGGLAGGNAGSIDNCAVAGVSLAGNAYTATVYIGGLVGTNLGTITGCGAECAALAADTSSYAHGYVGGLAGQNQNSGIISTSYAVGRASAVADVNSDAQVCGFVGHNLGDIQNSYSAMDLVSSGAAVETFGFCGVTAGMQKETFFLNIGNFSYRDIAYNSSYKPQGATGLDYQILTGRDAIPVKGMRFVDGSDGFPYPTALKNAAGAPIHYGKWPEQMNLGVMGVYYWEKLKIAGQDPTYHVSLLSAISDKKNVVGQTTLSNAHVDNGVVTDYGYGYYNAKGAEVTLTANGIYYRNGSTVSPFAAGSVKSDADVDRELADLMPGYVFHSYHSYISTEKSGSGLYPHPFNNRGNKLGTFPNGTFTLRQGSQDVTFNINPHFADALSVTVPNGWSLSGSAVKNAPGTKDNPYEVRALSQLQNINWCYDNRTTDTVMTEGNYQKFSYLSYSSSTGDYYWQQTHDLKGENEGVPFSPIAEYLDPSPGQDGRLEGWFSGSYDGGDYVIEGVSIRGHVSSCAGLFGVVYNGILKNIILYSSDGQSMVSCPDDWNDSHWYSVGTLAGVAASKEGSAIENCAVAGYKIEVNVRPRNGVWGGVNIGGLVGTTDMEFKNCSAITTVDISNTRTGYDNMRVGGLVGASPNSITNCFAGGEIIYRYNDAVAGDVYAIYIGGIVGGSYIKALTVGGDWIGIDAHDRDHSWDLYDTTNNRLVNCYSYVTLPKKTDRDKIRALYVLGGTGEINSKAEAYVNWDDKNHHGVCTIENSYYLNSIKPGYIPPNNFKTDINQAGVTGLTYPQLAGKDQIKDGRNIYSLLPAFTPVTAWTDDGFSVAGKYSYPAASYLQGMNYPFPTILTREGSYHVHYGDWPTEGIKRDLGGAPIELDLFTGLEHTETLKPDGVGTGGTWSVTSADETIVSVSIGQSTGTLSVTGNKVGITTLTVTYTVNGESYTLPLSVNVTAVLELRTAENPVELFTNDEVDVELTAYDKKGNLITQSGLTVMVSGINCETDLLEACVPDADSKTLGLTTGSKAGDTTVTVSYRYIYNGEEYTRISAINLRLTEPEITCGTDENEGKYYVRFSGADIKDVNIEGEGGSEPSFEGDTVTLNMPEGTEETEIEVTLALNGREHVVKVTVRSKEQDDENDSNT